MRRHATHDLAAAIADALRAKYPAPVKRTSGTAIWEDAHDLALPEVRRYSAADLLDATDLALERHQKWSGVLNALRPYDETFREGGLRGVLEDIAAEAVADHVRRVLTSTQQELDAYEFYS